ncbi:MAG: DegT/DnrJ/EryC1/StrS family aminotransferase [Gemmatimonadaceae bacterium]
MIRLTVPSIDDEDLDAIRDVVASGFLIQGPHVADFEKAVATMTGASHAVAVANGTCALQLALGALDFGPGDICVMPAYSWVATANVVELCGGRPVFVDIDAQTFNIDTGKLEQTLSKLGDQKVKAVMPVHAFGQMASMREITEICDALSIPVIEDAACALGAKLDGRNAGTWSQMGCFSFHPRKAVTTGEGGMVITGDASLARRLRALRNHGADPDSSTQDFICAGYNYRLTEFQGAFGVVQMSKVERIVARRREAAARYDKLLTNSPLTPPAVAAKAEHVYQAYVTLLPPEVAKRRPEIIRAAREQGVELQIGTIHMPLTTYYRGRYNHRVGEFPVTDSVAARTLALPIYESITAEQQQEVVEVTLALVT